MTTLPDLEQVHHPHEGSQQVGPGVGAAHRVQVLLGEGERVGQVLQDPGNLFLHLGSLFVVGPDQAVHELMKENR